VCLALPALVLVNRHELDYTGQIGVRQLPISDCRFPIRAE